MTYKILHVNYISVLKNEMNELEKFNLRES